MNPANQAKHDSHVGHDGGIQGPKRRQIECTTTARVPPGEQEVSHHAALSTVALGMRQEAFKRGQFIWRSLLRRLIDRGSEHCLGDDCAGLPRRCDHEMALQAGWGGPVVKFVAMMFDSHGSGTVGIVLGRRARVLTCAVARPPTRASKEGAWPYSSSTMSRYVFFNSDAQDAKVLTVAKKTARSRGATVVKSLAGTMLLEVTPAQVP